MENVFMSRRDNSLVDGENGQMRDCRDDLMRLIAEGSERCVLCRKPFGNNVSIYSGVADNGAIAVVGDCCIDRMKEVHAIGVTEKHADFEERIDA
jgi:hypothetical protein